MGQAPGLDEVQTPHQQNQAEEAPGDAEVCGAAIKLWIDIIAKSKGLELMKQHEYGRILCRNWQLHGIVVLSHHQKRQLIKAMSWFNKMPPGQIAARVYPKHCDLSR